MRTLAASEGLPTERITLEIGRAELGVYVHVPFCARRCGYCAFTTVAVGDGDREAQERYTDLAVVEVTAAELLTGERRPPLTSVYFGGGTPTLLSDEQFCRLLDAITSRFDHVGNLEVTVEANPDGLRPGQLAALRAAGATRISFGMQSLSSRVLRTLDRTHDPHRALSAVRDAASAGFEHVSLDLIYGTPGETTRDWSATVDAVTATGVDHVSAYALGIEPGTRLAARVRAGALPDPDPDEAAVRYLDADRRLSAAGFEWYELSNWARSPASRCRHNELYWRNQDWIGIGPGAHSHVAGLRWWNHESLTGWADAVSGGRPPAAGHEVLTETQRRMEAVMLGLRRSDGLPVGAVGSPDEVPRLRAEGLVRTERGCIVLSTAGRLVADQVVRRLI